MRIERLEAVPVALPFRERYRTASGELDARAMLVVRLHAADGTVGLGEAVPLSLRGGPGLEQMQAELAGCGAVLAGADAEAAGRGEPERTRAWIHALLMRCRRAHAGAGALAALDMALHDLVGKLSSQPVWRLLGVREPRGVSCNATLDAGEPDAVGERAAAQRRAGFRTFKVKVGTGDDGARLRSVRAAIGTDARLRIDANGAWSPGEAIAALARLEPCDLELAEQPVADAVGLAQVRSAAGVPIVADESVASAADAESVRGLRACDAATAKLAKVGGLLETLRIAAVLPTYLSSALDGPVGIAAAAHLAQALPRAGYAAGLDHGLATLGMFARTYADGATVARLSGPRLEPGETPGLGVEIDEDRLAEVRLS